MLEFISNPSTHVMFQIGIVIILATLFAFFARLFRQPLILAYIITGVLLGPLVLGWINDLELVKSLSEIGIAFLLFVVGLEIDIKKLREVGLISVIGGFLQVVLVFFLGYFVATSIGFEHLIAMYLGVAIAFSSTMVVVKFLSDRTEIDTLHGRIILGFLLVQDLVAMIALAMLLKANDGFSWLILLPVAIKILVLLLLAVVGSWYLFPRLFSFAAKSKEFLFLASVTVCFLFALIASLMDFSIAIGAFIAGVSMASLPYVVDIKGRVEPIKDFFATIFFVTLGIQLVFTGLGSFWELLGIFLILILVLKPILIFLLGVFFGYSSQVSFMSGIYLAQISEFSLILVTGGLMIGDITGPIFSLVVLMMAISVIVTSYFVQHAHGIYGLGQNFLEWFEKLSVVKRDRLEYKSNAGKKYTVLIGCGKMGTIFIDTLRRLKQDVRVLDNNPEVIKNLVKRKLACTYGDSTSRAVLDSLKLKNVKILISTIPDLSVNQFILSYAKQINPKIIVILTTNRAQDVLDLYDLGADYVIVPRVISGENMSEMLSKLVKSKNILVGQRKNNIKIIEELQDLGLG